MNTTGALYNIRFRTISNFPKCYDKCLMAQIVAQESELLLSLRLNTAILFIFQCQQAVWPQPSPEDITIHYNTGGAESNNLIWFIWHIFTFNFSDTLCWLSLSWPAMWLILFLAEMHVGLRSENFYYSNFYMGTEKYKLLYTKLPSTND